MVDATGLFVSPGWIDLHAHIFLKINPLGVHPDRDAGVNVGVTTVADPGGFCSDEIQIYRREIVEKSVTRVVGFVNVAAHRNQPNTPMQGDFALFDQELTIKTIEENRDVIKGVKVLSSIYHAGNLTLTPTQLAVQAARESGTRVVAHIGMAPPLIQDVLNLLGPGDFVTHCFKGFPMGIFHRDGRPVAEAWKALERGVSFDLGHGQGSFACRSHSRKISSQSASVSAVASQPRVSFGASGSRVSTSGVCGVAAGRPTGRLTRSIVSPADATSRGSSRR